jgi:hypothetical protein
MSELSAAARWRWKRFFDGGERMAKSSPDPIEALVAKFRRASNIEVKFVRGTVEQVDTLTEGGKNIYVLHIANGPQRNSFWLAHNYGDPYFHAPRNGDHVKGVINTLDDNLDFCGEIHKPIFDFVNESNDNERSAFAWFNSAEGERFAREAAIRRGLDDKARDTLYRQLGLSGLQKGPQ